MQMYIFSNRKNDLLNVGFCVLKMKDSIFPNLEHCYTSSSIIHFRLVWNDESCNGILQNINDIIMHANSLQRSTQMK